MYFLQGLSLGHYVYALQYKDSEGDKVLLATNDDLVEAMNHAKSIGWKVIDP